MTLEEIREMTILGTGERIPTLEEMLEAADGRVKLFIELKGESADERMADDVVAIIKEKGMENECVMISLSYPVLSYIVEHYPEMETGYLYATSVLIEQKSLDIDQKKGYRQSDGSLFSPFRQLRERAGDIGI